ncbi:MAG: glycine cleavage system aminomethyltransferase GcvT [Nannocystaceae bacterium]
MTPTPTPTPTPAPTQTTAPRQTALFAAHVARGAKLVDFGGWHMPLQYVGILAEHRAVREAAGIFDVSHMGEIDFRGPRALEAVQGVITNDATRLADGRALYTAVCYPDGGIVDDCIVYRRSAQDFRLVVNASNTAKDLAFFHEHAGQLCDIADRSEQWALIAVQGPDAPGIVAELGEASWLDLPSFAFASGMLAGVPVEAARTGYTGEDGFELFVPAHRSESVWNALLDAGTQPIGLGARDTLRLEARLCLYGHDIDETTTAFEAGLGWVVKLDKLDKTSFTGQEALAALKQQGRKRKLVGFRVEGRGIARPHAEILDADDRVVGQVTSGGPAPTAGGAVGMAYIPAHLAGPGDTIQIRQRGKVLTGRLVQGPFYKRDR